MTKDEVIKHAKHVHAYGMGPRRLADLLEAKVGYRVLTRKNAQKLLEAFERAQGERFKQWQAQVRKNLVLLGTNHGL